jgi:copper chaperone CopZ
MNTILNISGMHCNGCVERLTRALRAVPGVESVKVTLAPPRAEVVTGDAPDVEALRGAVRGAGAYSVVEDVPVRVETGVVESSEKAPSLYPLFLIVGFIVGVCGLAAVFRGGHGEAAQVAAQSSGNLWHGFMLDFMAGFFLVFSFFKLLDVRGFASAYGMYDIVAARWRGWGLVYPFVELGLGVAYLVRWELTFVNAATLVLMLIGAVGVIRAVVRKDRIRCACLGTALNLPMTTVTIVEDVGMAVMAAGMLVWGR